MRATCERSLYRTVVKESKETIYHPFLKTNKDECSSGPSMIFAPPSPGSALPPGSGPACVHYSFDFAQQVHYPHNPLQPGPMYFKTAR